ncbi:MAG TPA: RNA methyltransferase [Methylophilaceae bacterium]|nr:RNA methyltransferase [Methylophilaceae bacterium]
MTFKHITSRDNNLFKQLKKLADSSRERRKLGETLLDGVHLLEGYLQHFGEPSLLVIPEGDSSPEATGLLQTLADVPTVMFPTLMFSELTPVASPTGILALVKVPPLMPPETVDLALLLEDIQDPGNLGSMLRTAAAAGVDAVYLSTGCTDAWSPKALRGGQGAHFVLPVVERVDLLTWMQGFHGQTLATAMQGESLYAQDLRSPTAFIIGNEGIGLSQPLMAAASRRINIPIGAGVESLNAAAASAICLFESVRQRKAA